MARRASMPASPVTITVSQQSKKTTPRSIGLTSPLSRRRYTLSPKQENVEESVHYTVHIPPTPERSLNSSQNISSLSGTIFTGGFNSATKGRVIESSENDSVRNSSGIYCRMNGCDGDAMLSKMPCECGYRICKDCYEELIQNNGHCPGCKESYRGEEEEDNYDDDDVEDEERDYLPLNSVVEFGGGKQRSMMRSTSKNDFDHNRWLFETKGTYGYGNALWPKDSNGYDGFKGFNEQPNFGGLCKRPLTRKVSVSQAILSPYRLLIVIRLVALGFFLAWRIRNPNHEAMYLWALSIICELWFAFSWILDQLPKLCPVNRATDLAVLKERFETPNARNPKGRSDLPGIDVFVSTADPEKEPPLVTCNTVLSILAADYPVEKFSCYLSDDGGSLLTFEALAEAASFARIWVPFCRKHSIEPRNPEAYFGQKRDFLKNKVKVDFVRERRKVKREYDEFKVRINSLPESIRRRSDAYNAQEDIRCKKKKMIGEIVEEEVKVVKATWMSDGSHWPGTWLSGATDHTRGDHAGIIQAMLAPPCSDPTPRTEPAPTDLINTEDMDTRLPMLVYVSREKRPGFDHNKKAGAMNSLVRSSSIMSNAPFILNLDCDHYVYNSLALRHGICFMLDRGGDRICFVQFPQRFEGIDPNDRYANHNLVFFDVTMRAMDGLQGPMYVGTGCLFRRTALYGFPPPRSSSHLGFFGRNKIKSPIPKQEDTLLQKRYGDSTALTASIPIAEYQGRLLQDTPGVTQGRPAGALTCPREPLDASTVAEAISVISCSYEDRTEWGTRVGWIYGSVTEDVVTGYRMHNRGWRSVYCVTKRDAFRGSAPINLTDRLHQVLRWATGSVEIFFSRNNAILASPKMKFLQRVAYFNTGVYPFTSIFLMAYCFLPAVSLFTGQFIVRSLDVTFLSLLLTITVTMSLLAVLEIRWSKITFHEWWRNEQFWVIGGTSAHPAAVVQGILKVVAGLDVSFTLTSKPANDDGGEDLFAELYVFKWSFLMVPPTTIMMVNVIAVGVGVCRAMYSEYPQWSRLVGGVFFSVWVLCHLYPFAKGLMGRRGKVPTIVYVWSGLVSIVVSMLWVYVSPPVGAKEYML